FLEKAARLRRRIISAMIYPSVVLSVAAIIVLGIMLFIVPSFTEIFNDFDTELPGMTVMLIDFSSWLAGPLFGIRPDMMIPGIVWVLLSPIFILGALKLIRKSKTGKTATDWIVLALPIVGGLVSKATIA